jgi:hypothetical protein
MDIDDIMGTKAPGKASDREFSLLVAAAILETVDTVGPGGAPASSIYLALQARGISFDVYSRITRALVAAGLLISRHDCFFVGPKLAGAKR